MGQMHICVSVNVGVFLVGSAVVHSVAFSYFVLNRRCGMLFNGCMHLLLFFSHQIARVCRPNSLGICIICIYALHIFGVLSCVVHPMYIDIPIVYVYPKPVHLGNIVVRIAILY